MASTTSNFALPDSQLESIAREACDKALTVPVYDPARVAEWNGAVIKSILSALIAACPRNKYKFAVNSTLIQHDSLATAVKAAPPPSAAVASSEETGDAEAKKTAAAAPSFAQNSGRGMHSATGSFWDASTDGMWSFKMDGAGVRGFDVVVSVVWVGMVGVGVGVGVE